MNEPDEKSAIYSILAAAKSFFNRKEKAQNSSKEGAGFKRWIMAALLASSILASLIYGFYFRAYEDLLGEIPEYTDIRLARGSYRRKLLSVRCPPRTYGCRGP